MNKLEWPGIEDVVQPPATWFQVRVDYRFLYTDGNEGLNYKISEEFFIRLRKVYEGIIKKTCPEMPEEMNVETYMEWAYPLMSEIGEEVKANGEPE